MGNNKIFKRVLMITIKTLILFINQYFSDVEKETESSLKRSHESEEEIENLNKKLKVESILDDIE